jgi:dTDP-4-amino-4,6-dideoxygalactose transaminase
MTITLTDVAWQHAQVRAEIDEAIDRLLTDTYADGTPFIAALEDEFTRRLGDGIHAIAVQSGLAAEFLILKALGIGPGDEVITVPNSDIATTAPISHAGARFVLVDVDPQTHNLDPERIEAAITPRTRAIVPVHMYGLPAAMEEIMAIACRHGLAVIEDATLALGASYRGAPAGSIGDAGFFSFAPRKVLGGTGRGGLVATRDAALADRVRLLRGYGLDPRRGDAPIQERERHAGLDHLAEGFNLQLNPMEAAIIIPKLARADEWAARRQAVADRYAARLAGAPGIALPEVPPGAVHAWRNYVVRVPQRDQVRERLRERGIATAVLYTPPIHLQPVYRGMGFTPGDFPAAEALSRDLLCLPMHPGLTTEEVEHVAAAVIAACEEHFAAARRETFGDHAAIRVAETRLDGDGG